MEFYQQFVKETYDADGVLTEFAIQCPEHFNFGYDVVDALAEKDPKKLCMVWCDQEDRERYFTFGEMARLSNQAANVLKAHGIGKGDRVMLMLSATMSTGISSWPFTSWAPWPFRPPIR